MDLLRLVARAALRDRASDHGTSPPIVIANPVGDRRFRNAIDGYLLSGGREARELENALRVRYPHAVVRPRDLAGERSLVWYAYREGHWIGRDWDVET